MGKLKINGTDRQFEDGIPGTLSRLLAVLSLSEATVVAEIDGKIVSRDKFSETELNEGQKIELIRFVGGG